MSGSEFRSGSQFYGSPAQNDDKEPLGDLTNGPKKIAENRRYRSAKSYYNASAISTKAKKSASPKPKNKKNIKTPVKAPRPRKKSEPGRLIKAKKTETLPLNIFEDSDHLPPAYDITFVQLIARDPHWLYAYWEISAQTVAEIRQQIGDLLDQCAYTLRVYDVTLVNFNGFNANFFNDYDGLHANNRYIHFTNDNASYCAEIGVRDPYGRFYPFTRSNFVNTQRSNHSHRSDLIWKQVDDHLADKNFVNIQFDAPSPEEDVKTVKVNWQINLKRISLSIDEIKTFYIKTEPLKQLLRHRVESLIREKKSDTYFNEDWSIEESLLPGLITGKYSYRKAYLGASETLITEFEGASEEIFFKQVKAKKQKPFPFKIDMRLIVTGATEPDATVTLGDKKIDLDPDGLFQLEYHLQDGILPLNFTATSADNEHTRKISTSVTRERTQYEYKCRTFEPHG